jgi:hypothetical protein
VAAGNALVIVRGNHDIELFWDEAQRALCDAIVDHEPPQLHALLRSRIEITPWFFAVDGLLYVEHGHEFDPLCSYGDPLGSTCARDPRRIRWTAFSVLLRFVARPTQGVSSGSYSYAGMGAYLHLLLKLGWRGSLAIASRYARASHRLLAECVHHTKAAARERAFATRVSITEFAHRSGVSEERLRSLCALYVPPAVQRFGFMLRSLYLDRILCGLAGAAGLLLASLCLGYVGVISALIAVLLFSYALVGSGKNSSPQATMLHNAKQIAQLFSARWVVMGHTHEPIIQAVSESASYVNLGSWGEDDPPEERSAQRDGLGTFLILRRRADDFFAELLRWDEQLGPLAIEPTLPTVRTTGSAAVSCVQPSAAALRIAKAVPTTNPDSSPSGAGLART